MSKLRICAAMMGKGVKFMPALGLVIGGLAGCVLPVSLAPVATGTAIATHQAVTLQAAPSAIPATITPEPTQAISPLAMPTLTSTPAVTPRLIAYFYGGNARNQTAEIPQGMLTDIIYAFLDIAPDGSCRWMNPAEDAAHIEGLKLLRKAQPGLSLLVSVGGYGNSGRFSSVAASTAGRRKFAASCIQLLLNNGLDGIDIDWEYPADLQEKQNFTALLAELRQQLDGLGKTNGRAYLLSIAAPAGPHMLAYYDLGQIQAYLDWITLMAYDFYTGDSRTAQLVAPLFATDGDPGSHAYNGDAAVQAYISRGVPASKIVLGVPFYGRGWRGVSSTQNGLFQAASGPYNDPRAPAGIWGAGGEIEYRALKQYYLGRWTRFWQDQAQAPWLYNAADRVMVSYDDPQSLAVKADYARTKELGGVAVWQISSDDDSHALLTALKTHLLP